MKKPHLEETKRELEKAKIVLRPFFDLEGELRLKLSQSKDGIAEIDYFFNGEHHYSVLPYTLDTPFDIGRTIGMIMYGLANPKIEKERDDAARKDVKKYGAAVLSIRAPEDPVHTLVGAYNRLVDIIDSCCGFAFSEFKEYVGKHAIEEREDIISDTWKEIAGGREEGLLSRDTFLNAQQEALHSLRIANQLYRQRGFRIISELACLSFEEARPRIMDYVRIDILSPLLP